MSFKIYFSFLSHSKKLKFYLLKENLIFFSKKTDYLPPFINQLICLLLFLRAFSCSIFQNDSTQKLYFQIKRVLDVAP